MRHGENWPIKSDSFDTSRTDLSKETRATRLGENWTGRSGLCDTSGIDQSKEIILNSDTAIID